MAATATMPYQQQQPGGEILANPEAVPRHSSSGSIGPFFAVISVLTVLSVLSCIFGRMYSRRQAAGVSPLESIEGRGCFGWIKRKCLRRVDVAAKVMCFRDNKNYAKSRDDGDQVPNLPQP